MSCYFFQNIMATDISKKLQPRGFEIIVLHDLKTWTQNAHQPGRKDCIKSSEFDIDRLFCCETLDEPDSDADTRDVDEKQQGPSQSIQTSASQMSPQTPPNSPTRGQNSRSARPNPYVECLVRVWEEAATSDRTPTGLTSDLRFASDPVKDAVPTPMLQERRQLLLPFTDDDILVLRDDTLDGEDGLVFENRWQDLGDEHLVPSFAGETRPIMQNPHELEPFLFVEDDHMHSKRWRHTVLCDPDHTVPTHQSEE